MKRLFYLFAVLVLAAGCGTRTGQPAGAASDDDAVTVQPADSALLSGEVLTDEELMREAIRLSEENVRAGGGPFGAVIAHDGRIIARGANRVTPNHDPTAHAEISAIRAACQALGTFDLTGCTIYSSCEPCPMCLGAIYWAHLDKLYYGNDQHDAAHIGFDDAFIYEELALDPAQRRLKAQELLPEEAFGAFRLWMEKSDKVEY